ncbi:hypothetical protein N646_0830 [Vibrio alginolyticus NBRC 15630 = ATCC 17749]|uniref:Uncharacterized protein n=1 Tax=Vibrio alginolyticus (strain ATCC 17749 / DSM 2171 / NBRC 15630 / NCIMB 1903 / NCTC 12160 / XII-53) TaxID=1219076 RepID=A0A2I3C541_VIBAX|nr:hypothetical protein N646_0830 [Vibrio alginolyticus NBRC 15630 = ATCC 17749]
MPRKLSNTMLGDILLAPITKLKMHVNSSKAHKENNVKEWR